MRVESRAGVVGPGVSDVKMPFTLAISKTKNWQQGWEWKPPGFIGMKNPVRPRPPTRKAWEE